MKLEIVPIFLQIFGRMPTCADRNKIQAIVWLLAEKGIELGDYTFIQQPNGKVHSNELDIDLKVLFEMPIHVATVDFACDVHSVCRDIKELIAVFGEDSLYDCMCTQYERKYCCEQAKLHHACDELLETSRRLAEKLQHKWGL